MRNLCFILLFGTVFTANAQDTTFLIENRKTTLPEVFVRNHFDYKRILKLIKEDTTFYKAFRNLRILNYSSYNNIQMLDKHGGVVASLLSKTQQIRRKGCRTMKVLEQHVTGDFYNQDSSYNYFTAQLYASLFFTKGTICGEDNIVKGHEITATNKKGIDKHKEQLKMLLFNPGKKIMGIPFIGDKLDLYDEKAMKLYDYKLDIVPFHGSDCYTFAITPKEDLGFFKRDDIVVDEMTTWFDMKTLSVLARKYQLSYKAGLYDFDVTIDVEMDTIGDLTVPKVLRYKGNWNVLFKKRERGIFTATLFNFSNE